MEAIVRLLVLCLLLGFATFQPVAEPPADQLLAAGPMPAWAEMTSAAIWVQTIRACSVQLRYWPKGDPANSRLSEPISATAAGDHIALFALEDLAFGTRYAYELYLDGRLQKFEWPLEFQTQQHWRWRSDPPDFTFTLGSCLYINDSEFDRPGTPYGGDFELLDALADEQADFMLWLGDNTYLREPDWLTERGIRRRYAHTRAFDKLQRVLATRHNYAIWDDHDFGPNDSDRGYRLKEPSLQAFKDYWPAVQYGTAETPGLFQRFEWGDVEFFMLDDRYYRTPNRAVDETKTMFGAGQLQWLKDGLSGSVATFKVVAGGGQMLNPIALFEGLANVSHEQTELLDYIQANRIDGVLFLSGDRHMSELIRVTPDGGYPLYDFTSSPLSSGSRPLSPDSPEFNNPSRVPDTLVSGHRNYGRISVSGPRGARAITMSCHGKDGAAFWTHTVAQAELRFAR